MAAVNRPVLTGGVYVPTLVFFHQDETLDLETVRKHAVRMAQAGVAGIVTHGSNGEAVHLNPEERFDVTKATRDALDGNGYKHLPVIVGCSAESVRLTVELCKAAKEAGGDHALILPPSYYSGLFAPKNESVIEYFTKVADQSPIPILIYNYPPVTRAIDLSSDLINQLAKHPNIVGCKLTCGNTGKLNRIVDANKENNFKVFGGSADFMNQTGIGGGAGSIIGFANVAPKICVRLMELQAKENWDEAKKLQAIIARGDGVLIRTGLVGGKAVLKEVFGYGGYARSPLPQPTAEQGRELALEFGIAALRMDNETYV